MIADFDSDRRFRELAARMSLDPDARFVGGYVDWEWHRSRHLFDGLLGPVKDLRVLELGCNVGATAIVLAALGAAVTAVDPDPSFVELARANAARYGLLHRVRLLHVADTRALPLEAGSFDWVSCNSVLEYVDREALPGVEREIDRVLRRGGLLAILGSSNRLWPREGHSRRWLVNYLPRRLDPLLGTGRVRRGLTAWEIRAGFPGYTDLMTEDGGRLYLAMKSRMGAGRWKLGLAAALSRPLGAVGVSLGSLAPTLTMVLRKG